MPGDLFKAYSGSFSTDVQGNMTRIWTGVNRFMSAYLISALALSFWKGDAVIPVETP